MNYTCQHKFTSGGWDEAAWAANGVPAEGVMAFTLKVFA
jgi:hypothetical protein